MTISQSRPSDLEDQMAETFGMDPEADEDYFPMDMSIINAEQQKEIKNNNDLNNNIYSPTSRRTFCTYGRWKDIYT